MSIDNLASVSLDHSPGPIVVVDPDNKIQVANQSFATLSSHQADLLTGIHADSDPVLKALLGERSVITVSAGSSSLHFQRSSSKIEFDGSHFMLHYYMPIYSTEPLVNENAELRQMVEKLTLTDELTGLANERALSQQLAIQVTRTRRYHNPLTLVILSLEIKDDDYSHILDQAYNDIIITFSHFLRERLRWADFIARCQAGRFVIFLPETGAQEASRLFDDIINDKNKLGLPEEQIEKILLSYGVAEWEKGNDPRILVERASLALNQALNQALKQIPAEQTTN